MWTRKSITETITAAIVFLFLYTGLSKYADLISFKFVLTESPLLKNYAGFVAAVLPGVEIAVVLLLIVSRTRLWGLVASFGLLSLFTLYIIYMISFAPFLPCSCGGVISKLSWRAHIFFNIFFILLTIVAIRNQRKMVGQHSSSS